MKLGIVGSRNYTDYVTFTSIMNNWISEYKPTIECIVSGGAKGVDSLAARYASDNGIPLIVYEADWQQYGRSAGPKRNTLIADSIDYLIAMPSKDSVGTWDTITKVRRLTKPVSIFTVGN